jgi:hypothetical protein
MGLPAGSVLRRSCVCQISPQGLHIRLPRQDQNIVQAKRVFNLGNDVKSHVRVVFPKGAKTAQMVSGDMGSGLDLKGGDRTVD